MGWEERAVGDVVGRIGGRGGDVVGVGGGGCAEIEWGGVGWRVLGWKIAGMLGGWLKVLDANGGFG